MGSPGLKKVKGQKSWVLKSDQVKACVTCQGGHLGPVTFNRAGKGKRIKPYSVAPWAGEKLDSSQPEIIKVLRGDFFCMPFGANTSEYKGEEHPLHGEPANEKWHFQSLDSDGPRQTLHLDMKTKVRSGHVDKFIRLIDGENVVYSQHAISQMKGPMSVGHHAMLTFPKAEGSGLISTSPFVHGQTFVEPTEKPEQGGYSILKPDTAFSDLAKVPMVGGRHTDLSSYPARRGYEDIAILVSDPTLPFAWTAVSFPGEGYVWFSLKDPAILASTLLWISNAGRHYAPWSGRHANIMGLEEITGYFHYGLAESARKNPLSDKGFRTSHVLRSDRELIVNYIQGVVPIDSTFGRVVTIAEGEAGQIALTDEDGATVTCGIDLDFLRAPRLA